MRAGTKETKAVTYAYAFSDHAAKFGFLDHGCYVVEIIKFNPHRQPPVAMRGFPTFDDARRYAETLPMAWDEFTR